MSINYTKLISNQILFQRTSCICGITDCTVIIIIIILFFKEKLTNATYDNYIE